MRFFLLLLVAGAIALYFTNPSADEVKAKLNGQLPAELSGAVSAMPAPAPADQSGAPVDATAPAGVPADVPAGVPADVPSVPAEVPPVVTETMQGDMQLERRDYYLFSIYNVSVAGQQTPGCLIGIAKQVIPYGKC